MGICNHCGKTIDTLPFKCKFCKMEHCPQCRLPETHNCSALSDYKLYMHTKFRKNASELVNKYYKTYEGDYEVIVDRQNYKQTTKENKYNAPSKVMKKYAIEKPFDEANRKRSSTRGIKIKNFIYWLNEKTYPNTYNVNFISASSVLVILSSIAFFVFYSYMHEINKFVEGYFLGTVLLAFSGVFLIHFIVESFKDAIWWFNYAKRWKRYATIILLIFLISCAGQQNSTMFGSAGELYDKMLVMVSSLMINTQSSLDSSFGDMNKSLQPQPKEESKVSFEYINQIRAQYGRRALEWDDKLYELATMRAEDVYTRRYFDHVTPEGECVKDFKASYGLSQYSIAENLWASYTGYDNGDMSYSLTINMNESVDGWMNSRGHRYNLLYRDHLKGAFSCYYGVCVFLGANNDPYGLGAGPCSTGEEGSAYWEDASKQPGEV